MRFGEARRRIERRRGNLLRRPACAAILSRRGAQLCRARRRAEVSRARRIKQGAKLVVAQRASAGVAHRSRALFLNESLCADAHPHSAATLCVRAFALRDGNLEFRARFG